jgi:AcrR family transcriptional regulator
MKRTRIDIASIRREQIIEAAVAIIAEQGLQNLSLSKIENRAGMSRGQLTYYFKTWEDILLAVFDRLLQLMYERIGTPPELPAEQPSAWPWIRHLLETVPEQPRVSPEFHCLQYTFLSQIGHRADFRRRLANLYGEWRNRMTEGLIEDLQKRPAVRPVSPRALATLVQAVLHGLAVQHAADPESFDTVELLHLSLDMLGRYLWGETSNGGRRPGKAKKRPRRAVARGMQR